MAVQEKVSADSLWKDLEGICRWERYTGTAGENAAVRYIEAELSSLGIEVTVHAFESLISIPGAATLHILGEAGERISAITAVFGASTGAAGVIGQAVYVGEAGPPELRPSPILIIRAHRGSAPWRGASSWRRGC